MFNQLVFPYERSLSPARDRFWAQDVTEERVIFGAFHAESYFFPGGPASAPAASARFPSHFSQLHILSLKPCRLRLKNGMVKKNSAVAAY